RRMVVDNSPESEKTDGRMRPSSPSCDYLRRSDSQVRRTDREAPLIKRAFVFVSSVCMLVAVSPGGQAHPQSVRQTDTPIFGPASALGGSGGARASTLGFLPLHPGAYERAKAQADAIARSS